MKIPTREIQLFVAGAIAVNGFDALFWLFHSLAKTHDAAMIFAELTGLVALPLGVGMLIGRAWAIRWTQIYLWIVVIGGITGFAIYCYTNWPRVGYAVWQVAHDTVLCVILLVLLLWSRSQQLRQEAVA
jgi:hypothetical protein